MTGWSMLRTAESSSSSSWISFGLALVSTVRVGLLPSLEYSLRNTRRSVSEAQFSINNFFLNVIYLDVDANVGTLRLLLNQQMRGAVAGPGGLRRRPAASAP